VVLRGFVCFRVVLRGSVLVLLRFIISRLRVKVLYPPIAPNVDNRTRKQTAGRYRYNFYVIAEILVLWFLVLCFVVLWFVFSCSTWFLIVPTCVLTCSYLGFKLFLLAFSVVPTWFLLVPTCVFTCSYLVFNCSNLRFRLFLFGFQLFLLAFSLVPT
jgi:hypothetical protein